MGGNFHRNMQFRHAFRRHFDPWNDIAQIPTLLYLLYGSSLLVNPIIYLPAITLFVLAVLFLFFCMSIGMISTVKRFKYRFVALPAVLLIFLSLGFAFGRGESITDKILAQLSKRKATRAEPVAQNISKERDRPVSAVDRGAFSRLGNRNVLMFIVESYGFTTYSKPAHFKPLQKTFKEVEDQLTSSGYYIFSSFITSPVIGGLSWLADATLLTGIKIDSQQKYDALLRSETRSLPSILKRAGYYTLIAAPGTVHGDWEEGRLFYSFQESRLGWDYGYKGPMFSFVPVPDQYAIYFIQNKILKEDRDRPYFVLYTLVSSHGPFNKIPAYIEDWEKLNDGSIYYNSHILYFDNDWISGKQYDEGYVAAIRYVLTVLSGYLTGFIEDDTLIIVVGDHQPKFPVTVRGAPFSVPIHFISRDKSLLEPLTRHGYTRGLIPDKNLTHRGMETFLNTFLELMEEER